MKKYRDLLSELPSKSVVVTYGRFNPPSTGHELIIKVVRKLAKQRKADHIVFVSTHQDKKNPLEISKKIQYLELMFPNTKFIAVTDDVDCIGSLHKYKNVVMVTSADSVNAYTKLLKRGKFETTEVVKACQTDPDDDKGLKSISRGDYSSFKRSLPTSVRDLDAKRLMNDIRIGMGLEPIKEQINLVKDELREQYFRGEIFNEGDIVESDNTVYKIIKRGSNHLLLQTESGAKVSKWISDVQQTGKEFMEQLQESVSLTVSSDITKKSDKAEADSKKASLAAKHAEETAKLIVAQNKAMSNLKASLQKEDSPVVDTSKKYNIAKSIMSLSDFRKTNKVDGDTPEEAEIANKVHDGLIGNSHLGDDSHLRHMKIKKHYHEETEEQQDTRAAQLKRFKQQAAEAKLGTVAEANYKGLEKEDKPGEKKTEFKGSKNAVKGETVEGWKDEQKPVAEGIKSMYHNYMAKRAGKKADHAFDMNDEEGFKKHVDDAEKHRVAAGGKPTKINTDPDKKSLTYREDLEFPEIDDDQFMTEVQADLDNLSEEAFYEAYEDDELAIIDDETGEEIEAVAEEVELDAPALMEVLSRVERIKAKARMRRSKAKRERREKVALRQLSTPQVANKRARRMAISAMKKRLLRGQNPQKVSVGQKERVERFIQQRRKIVDRLAARMVSRVKQVEKARMSHKKFTKPNNGVSF